MPTQIEKLRGSIADILIRDGEATPRQLSDKLNTDGTKVSIALKEMFDAGEVTREAKWEPSGTSGGGGKTFVYRHANTNKALTGAPPSPAELSRYVMLDGKRAARLTDGMYAQVQQHGRDKNSRMRITGPNPATQDQRVAARQRGMALPTGQYIELDIYLYKNDVEQCFGLVAPNKRTLDYLLLWHPEFRLNV